MSRSPSWRSWTSSSKESDDVGRNAREVIRHLDSLRARGRPGEGVRWNGQGGTIRIEFGPGKRPEWLKEDVPDNRIIGVAWALAASAMNVCSGHTVRQLSRP